MFPFNRTCKSSINMAWFMHFSLIPAVVVIILLSFLQRRVRGHQLDERFPLNRRFGIVVPVYLVGNQSNRWSYGIAFGATTSTVVSLFTNEFSNYFDFVAPSWAKALVYLLAALEVGVDVYPFFACLGTEYKILGSVLGFLYSVSWLTVNLIDVCQCSFDPDHVFVVLTKTPSLVCQLFLSLKFIHMFFRALMIALGRSKPEETELILKSHHAAYIKTLLLKPDPEEEEEAVKQKSCFRRKCYDWDPHFKFPARMIATAVLGVICLYSVVLIDIQLAILVSREVVELEVSLDELVNADDLPSGTNSTIIQFVEFMGVAQIAWSISTYTAAATSVAYIFHILVCYRKHIKRLWRGDRSFLPRKQPKAGPMMAAGVRYTGWQIAYLLWGYLVLHAVQFLLMLLIAYGIVLPIMSGRGLALLQGLGISFLSIFLVIGVIVVQVIISDMCFLQPKINAEDSSRPLALNNIRAFLNFSYFFFFYDVMLGMGACIVRLLFGATIGACLVARIDRTIMPRGYEVVDMGYSTWIGMLHMDLYHSHPVLLAFCTLLLDGCHCSTGTLPKGGTFDSSSSSGNGSVSGTSAASKRARTSRARIRWLLLRTLLNNPHLIEQRKRRSDDSALPLLPPPPPSDDAAAAAAPPTPGSPRRETLERATVANVRSKELARRAEESRREELRRAARRPTPIAGTADDELALPSPPPRPRPPAAPRDAEAARSPPRQAGSVAAAAAAAEKGKDPKWESTLLDLNEYEFDA
ncbi:unnamed protein product [Lampetra planeri]